MRHIACLGFEDCEYIWRTFRSLVFAHRLFIPQIKTMSKSKPFFGVTGFRLKTDLIVHKRKEAAGFLTLAAPGAHVLSSVQSTKAKALDALLMSPSNLKESSP